MNFEKEVSKLSSWFLANQRPLPWRKNKNPYFIWISEVMLQQTTVVTVIPYFEKFIVKFPSIESLAKAPLEEVLESWSGLGYYSRARNLHSSAKLLAANGFSETYSELIQLPGFGPYTSRAVSSIAFNEPVGVLDGNVIRVISRKMGLAKKWWETKVKKEFQDIADQIASHGEASILNQAIMELGATICTPDKPLCPLCPWSSKCIAFEENKTSHWPLKKPRKNQVLWSFEPWLITKKNSLLFVKDRDFPFLKKIWLLPGVMKKVSTKPKGFLFKHSVTNNLIYVIEPQKVPAHKYPFKDIESRWLNLDRVAQHSPSSLTKKVLLISGLG